MTLKTGIMGYGTAVPRMRIRVEEIAKVWSKDGERIAAGINVKQKAVAAFDEDSCTLAVGAARIAVETAQIDAAKIGAVYVGSESKPYAVKPTASIVAEAIGASHELTAADLEFACKAGTAGMQVCMGLAGAGMIEYGVAIGSDTAQGKPGNALEYTAGSGAAAFVIGREDAKPIAVIDDTYSFTTDTPDFWRRQHQEFPSHAGRFTATPAYFRHVVSAAKGLLKKTNTTVEEYDYAVFHQPNGKFPLTAAKILGFPKEKVERGLITPIIGNTYSASSMIGLASVLDVAKPGEKIFVVSYGSGAGSDAFRITATDEIHAKGRRPERTVMELIESDTEYVDYATYAKHRRKIKSL
ncbi:hydroxymethylglutaryl-CoA synthase [Candidatus Micrarchaeota archaeon CG1_02_55_22]|nr:MAG: hydroxymethylglutaryl-CoA synthase [Candidatus Micrarchaeota archaeon CG1_02_55_22]